MSQIIGVRFKKVGKVYYFDPCGVQTQVGQHVIVETARGVEYGEVALENRDVEEGEVVKPLKKLIRVATPSDEKVVETNQKRAKEAFRICEQKIQEHHLDMKLVSVEYTFDLNKVLFYFTADGRVDFRELVKDLASVFRTRIELRQIGVRDEAKVLGGLGICGRPLCCASFLDDFQPVSINMAKQQNLSLNPTKISGTCGRLMCCLKYEQEAYEELSRVTPRPESIVRTPDGEGVVLDSSMLRGTCTVRLDDDPDAPRCYGCTQCEVLQAARKQRRPSHGASTRTEGRPAAAKPVRTPAQAEKPEADVREAQTAPVQTAPAAPETAPTQQAEKPAGESKQPRGEQQRKENRRPRRRRRPDQQQTHRETRKGGEETNRQQTVQPPKETKKSGADAPHRPRRRRPRRRPSSGGENKGGENRTSRDSGASNAPD